MRTPFMKYAAKYAIAGALALSLAAGGAVVAQAALTKNPAEVTAGNYDLESSHGKITWSVNHFGLSTYTGQFVNVKAELKLDPANPSASTLTATIPLTDVAPNDDRLKAHLQTADFFDTANHPTATFVSRSVTVDSDDANEATVVGDLTLRGVTKPVTIEVEFNGAGTVMGAYKSGFDGEATIKRSDFGINYALPAVSDEVKLHIEGEFVLKQ
ncbi:YceI family protein [Brevundimonas intermedia]|jgi:polyisoprenoid-binding protein YceI|uniref:YceI family protein n=1 Tax=Brevundimonas intermedia TaxID=74315 RepID=UPI003209E3A7